MNHLLIALLILAPVLAWAEKPDVALLKHPVQPCLWKVEGKGLEKPSWLFGTIHLGDEQVSTLHPKAEKAFGDSDAVFTELKLDPQSQMAMLPHLLRKDGKTLSQSIGEKLAAEIKAELKAINPALDLTPFEQFNTWAAAMTIPLIELQLGGQKPLDMVIYQRAQKAGKSVGGLESINGHLKTFQDLTEDEQVTLLADSIKMMREDRGKPVGAIERLRRIYLTGTAADIAAFMKEEMARLDSNRELMEKIIKGLLDVRNADMAAKAAELLAADPAKSHFFAVGAGHYSGDHGVQKLLQKKGYTVTPMFK